MNDLIETIAALLSVAIVLGVPTAFLLFVRYIGKKEQKVIEKHRQAQENMIQDSY